MDAKISYQILMKAIAMKKKLIAKYSQLSGMNNERRLQELRAELQELELQEDRFKVVDDD